MYFCPKCNYSFDISKSSKSENNENKEVVKKINDSIKLFESNADLNNYKAEFKKEELEKNIKYKKLSDENKEKFNKLFQESLVTNAEFSCNNCGFTKEITETILLYNLDLSDKLEKTRTLEENELISKNPILPRTRDYNCKNISCPTIKNKIDKEAVFFREKNSYKINYICTICNYSW